MHALNESIGSVRQNAHDVIKHHKETKSETPNISKQLIGLQVETKKTRFKLENFVLGGVNDPNILFQGPYETEVFADMPKNFCVPLS
jgi:hypothetical protein